MAENGSTGQAGSTWQRWSLLGLGGWTLLVWVGRIRNVAASDVEGVSFWWRLLVAVGFTLLGLTVVVGGVRRTRWALRAAVALAVIGSFWWIIRGTGILVGDHPVGFKVVHSVLAMVTLGFGWLVFRTRSLAPSQSDRYHPQPYG